MREQDAYRSQFAARYLFVESGDSGFEHATVCRQDGTAEVVLCPSSRQFQGTPSFFSDSAFWCHIRFGQGRRPAQRFFLLGFNELRIESSGHEAIVIISRSVYPGCGPRIRTMDPEELIISNTCLFWWWGASGADWSCACWLHSPLHATSGQSAAGLDTQRSCIIGGCASASRCRAENR